ncbi:MAG: phosphate/phosphonate ABC transporter permease [Bacilli bacterium]|jgi:phosphonate transport system permease protein|nr:phosphate/phosphonate ABC transporter permease [Bacilli bacterium]
MSETAVFIDPRYDNFEKPYKERHQLYWARVRQCRQDNLEAKAIYRKFKKEAQDKKQALIREGTRRHHAAAIVKPLANSARVHYQGVKTKSRNTLKESRYLIFPFSLFYGVVKANGSILIKPRGYALLSTILVFILGALSFIFIEPDKAVMNLSNFGSIFSQLFGPQGGMSFITTWDQWFDYMFHTAIPLIGETFAMMFVATTFGALIAIPFMILCSVNIINNRVVTSTNRFFLNFIRTIPTAVLAVMGVAFFGIGNLAGIFAMTVFTAGIIIKVMYEYIETVDMHPYEAILSTGATKPKAFVTSIFPQIIPAFLSNVVYTFEINIRASIILGYVNAGGIGLEISERSSSYQWNCIGAILVPLFLLVLVLQLFSNWLKRRTM